MEPNPTDSWGLAHTVLASLQSQEKPAWSQMAIRCREEVGTLYVRS